MGPPKRRVQGQSIPPNNSPPSRTITRRRIRRSYVGQDEGDYQGTDGRLGLAACMVAGTVSSVLAAMITTRIDDQGAGLRCGSCMTIVEEEETWEERGVEMERVEEGGEGGRGGNRNS